jgi:hypothetical protein
MFRSHLGMFLYFLLVKRILKLLLNFLKKKLIAIKRILQDCYLFHYIQDFLDQNRN